MLVILGAAVLNIFLGIPAVASCRECRHYHDDECLHPVPDVIAMINGGETNYIMPTAGLFLSILNIFTSAAAPSWERFSDD